MRTGSVPPQYMVGDPAPAALPTPELVRLTRMQLKVVRARCHGTNAETARELGISEQTVKSHISRALARAGVANFNDLLLALGWLVLPD